MAKTKSPVAWGSDAKWKAESDAMTFANAEAIKKDPSRLKAAAKAAKSMIDDKSAEIMGLKHIARKATK